MRVFVAGGWKDVTGIKVNLNGAWKKSRSMRAYHDGWKPSASFIASLTVSITPDFANGTRQGSGNCDTNTVQAVPTGGVAPFRYVWSRDSGPKGAALTTGTASTRFRAALGREEQVSSVFRCTVTDGEGTTAAATVPATFVSFTNDFGSGN